MRYETNERGRLRDTKELSRHDVFMYSYVATHVHEGAIMMLDIEVSITGRVIVVK